MLAHRLRRWSSNPHRLNVLCLLEIKLNNKYNDCEGLYITTIPDSGCFGDIFTRCRCSICFLTYLRKQQMMIAAMMIINSSRMPSPRPNLNSKQLRQSAKQAFFVTLSTYCSIPGDEFKLPTVTWKQKNKGHYLQYSPDKI